MSKKLNVIPTLLFLLTVLMTISNSQTTTDWCSGPCGREHVACYDPETDPHFCPNAKILEISPEDKRDIVDRYNYNRNRVATGKYPGTRHQASRMLKVHWDDDLELFTRSALLRCKTTTYCTKFNESTTAYYYTGWRYTDLNETELSFFIQDILYGTLIHNDYQGLHNEFMRGQLKSIVHNGFLQLNGTYGIAKPTSFDENLYKTACVFVLYDVNDNNESNFKPWVRSTCYYLFTKDFTTDMIMYKVGTPCSECHTVGRRCSKDFSGLCETSDDNADYSEKQGSKVNLC
ncbi:hypothetical protein DMENIID0001_145480 [Sergentomyia squamirostris]